MWSEMCLGQTVEFLHMFCKQANIMMDFNQRANLVPCYLLLLLICSVDKLEEFHEDTGCLPFERKFPKFRMEDNNN